MAPEQTPPPPDGVMAPGALVWGRDFNAASALLYRWWGILDAPAGAGTEAAWADLFDEEPVVATPELEGAGLDAIRGAVAARRRSGGDSSHHLDYDDIVLRWRAPGTFEIAATATVQVSGADGATASRCDYTALATRQADGRMLLQRIDGAAGEASRDGPFVPSYLTNRARATMVRFQAHMDGLSGRIDDMVDLMMPRLDLHGLIASKTDASAGNTTLTDVNDLRKSVSGSAQVADNVIRDLKGFAEWFATCTDLFKYGLHKLERFSAAPLAEGRVEAVAQFDWRAETLNGAKIETHQPLTWILVETGEAFMRIESLKPFG